MKFLIDHNLRGHAILLLGTLIASGWLDLIRINFVFFEDVNLSENSNDRIVWQEAQSKEMILLTGNRSMKGKDSLEQVLREENTPESLPVITIGNVDRILTEAEYREKCVNRLIEIVIDIDDYRGSRRIFIP